MPNNLPAYRGGSSAAVVATPFDPSTLSFNANVYKTWWHRDEATFKNGAAVAGNGDPVSRVITQSGSGGYNLDNNYGGGPSGVLRATGLELVNAGGGNKSQYLDYVTGSTFAPKTSGLTIGFSIAGATPNLDDYCNDWSPLRFAVQISNSGGHTQIIVGGDNADVTNLTIGNGAADAQLDGEQHTYLIFFRTNDATGAATQVAVYQDGVLLGSGALAATSTCSFFAMYTGDVIMKSRFTCSQNFEANASDLHNFLKYGSGV